MQKPEFRLTIKKIPCHIMNADPDYDVLLNGVRISGLAFRGGYYQGSLISHKGEIITLHDAEIGAWTEECASLNDEADADLRAVPPNAQSVEHVHETWDPQILRIAHQDDERHVQTLAFTVAVKIFGDAKRVPVDFCPAATLVGDEAPSSIEGIARWLLTKVRRDAVRTKAFLAAIAEGQRPRLDEDLRNGILHRLMEAAQDPAIEDLVSGFLFWFEDAYPETFGDALERLLTQIERANVWTDERFHQKPDFSWKNALALEIENKIATLRSERGTGAPWCNPLRSTKPAELPLFFSVRFIGLMSSCERMKECSPALKAEKPLVDLFVDLAQPMSRKTNG